MTTSSHRLPLPFLAGAVLATALSAGAPPGSAEQGSSPDEATAAATSVQETGFVFKEIPVDRESAATGEGAQVTLRGNPVVLHGRAIRVGDALREATLRDPATKSVEIPGEGGRVRILSIVPSLLTKTCEQQTHYLSEKSGDLDERVELVTISLDSPETQRSFAQEAEIENVTFLSDASDAAFGRAHGLLIEQPRLLTRAVLVVDAEGVVRYVQVVPEVSHMPDMEAAFDFARKLAGPDSAG